MAIGKFVQSHLPRVFEYCEERDPHELARLLDPAYSNSVFSLNWPFCRESDRIASRESVRYWAGQHRVCGKTIRVCSQWYTRHMSAFRRYLQSIGVTEAAMPEDLDPQPGQPITRSSRRGRPGATAFGDAQNAVIRVILSNLGEEAFSRDDLQAARRYFRNRCAYCDAEGAVVIDHAVPINKSQLGEHRLGNLIPSCAGCNSQKKHLHFRDYVSDKARLSRIEAYMSSKKYAPLGDSPQIKSILEEAYSEVRVVAERYIAMLNHLLVTQHG